MRLFLVPNMYIIYYEVRLFEQIIANKKRSIYITKGAYNVSLVDGIKSRSDATTQIARSINSRDFTGLSNSPISSGGFTGFRPYSTSAKHTTHMSQFVQASQSHTAVVLCVYF